MSHTNLSNEELMNETNSAVANERNAMAEVIRLFQEIAGRKLFLEHGYPTMFEMVTKHFGYCAASAMRRLQTARLIKDLPEFETKIATGELSLTAASQLQSFFYREATDYSREDRTQLVEHCLNKSTREVERELCRRNPEREKHETVRAISETRLRVSFSISSELNDKLDQLKAFLSHAEPHITTESLLERLVELGLDRHDPKRKAARAEKRTEVKRKSRPETRLTSIKEAIESEESSDPLPAPEVRARYVPADQKHKLAQQHDGDGCVFVDERSGRRCGSKHFLQLDHIESYSMGGANAADNLQVLCGAHNRLKWQRGSIVREPTIR